MFISKYLLNHKKYNFIIDATKKNIPITKILKFIHNKNRHGFCIIKEKRKFKFFSGGDLRKSILRDKKFLQKDNRSIKSKKFISIKHNKSLYDAYRIMSDKDINFLPVIKGRDIIAYLSLNEITEILSSERLNLSSEKLAKFNLDVVKRFCWRPRCYFMNYNKKGLFLR